MILYCCISSHGYGHAARQAVVISELHRKFPSLRIIISTAIDSNFLKLIFNNLKVEFRSFQWDIGVIQSNALDIDIDLTIKSLIIHEKQLPNKLKAESKWLKDQSDSIIILADIPPSASDLADQCNARLIWMGNFGWDDIYSELGDSFSYFTNLYSLKYHKGDFLLRCPFSLGMNWSHQELQIGLTAALPSRIPSDLNDILKNFKGPIVSIGFGGLGFDINPNHYKKWSNHLFIIDRPKDQISREIIKELKNTIYLPKSIRLLDILPYCSRHIGKPGYSSFCEGISQNVGMHVVNRQNFCEASVLIEGLKKYASHRLLDKSMLLSGDWQLDSKLILPREAPLPNNGAIMAVEKISEFLKI